MLFFAGIKCIKSWCTVMSLYIVDVIYLADYYKKYVQFWSLRLWVVVMVVIEREILIIQVARIKNEITHHHTSSVLP